MKRSDFSCSLSRCRRTRLLAEQLEARELLAGDVLPTVTLQTNAGDVTLQMCVDAAPQTVENFLNYVNDGDYDNVIFHRLVPGFVLQGGGFTVDPAVLCGTGCEVSDVDPSQFDVIPTDDPVVNEFNLSNTRGTVAMAKLGSDPNSATNQFFINLADNNDPDNPNSLDNQNGGFTVFAEVVDMTVPDEIAELPTGNLSSIFPTTGDRAKLGAISAAPLVFAENDDISLVRVESIIGKSVIQGTLRLDTNQNGIADEGDGAMAGYDVYLDLDDDGTHDSNEPTATTDSDGVYEFLVDPGTHSVRVVETAEFRAVSAATLTAELGAVTSGLDVAQVYEGLSFHNPVVAADANAVGGIAPLDALLVINELELRVHSQEVNGTLIPIESPLDTPLFIDIDNNSIINPLDALLVINELILQAAGAAAPAEAPVFPALSAGLATESSELIAIAAPQLESATMEMTVTRSLPVYDEMSAQNQRPETRRVVAPSSHLESTSHRVASEKSTATDDVDIFDSIFGDWQ